MDEPEDYTDYEFESNLEPEEVKCCGCGKYGEPNFDDDQYWCGGSPWCCP